MQTRSSLDGHVVTWESGLLRPGESIASFGAKYCFLNSIAPRDFYKAANTQVLSRRRPLDPSETLLGFDYRKFAEVLGEPTRIVRLMHSDSWRLGMSLEQLANVERVGALRICHACVEMGYHASFHQLSWLGRCPIHFALLEEMSGSLALNHVAALHDLWFQGKTSWRKATADWDRSAVRDRDLRAFRALVANLGQVDQAIEDSAGWDLGLLGGKSSVDRLMISIRMFKRAPALLKKLVVCDTASCVRSTLIEMDSDEVRRTMARCHLGIKPLMYGRIISCQNSSESTGWKKTLVALMERLLLHHEDCVIGLEDLMRRWGDTNESPWLGYRAAPAISLALKCHPLCFHLGAHELLTDLTTKSGILRRISEPYSVFDDDTCFPHLSGLWGRGHSSFDHMVEPFKPTQDDVISLRRVHASQLPLFFQQPAGALKQVVDVLLQDAIWRLGWAIKAAAASTQDDVTSPIPHQPPFASIENALKSNESTVSVAPCPSGRGLRVLIHSYVPYRMPTFSRSRNDARAHMTASKAALAALDERLSLKDGLMRAYVECMTERVPRLPADGPVRDGK